MDRSRQGSFRVRVLALATVAALAAVLSAAQAATTVYRWVDSRGVVHYSDTVPSRYAKDPRTVLNPQGVPIDQISGPQSATQRAEAAAAQQRAVHDRYLLATFSSTHDIEQLRDERISQIKGQIQASNLYLQSLKERLHSLQQRAMAYRPYNASPDAPRMPDELAQELVQTINAQRQQKLEVDGMRKQEVQTRARFAADIHRYQELTARARQ